VKDKNGFLGQDGLYTTNFQAKEADELMINKIIKYENEITQLKKELQEVKDDNRKLSLQISDMISKLRDAQY
jgi:seryl-tRNA synthetase